MRHRSAVFAALLLPWLGCKGNSDAVSRLVDNGTVIDSLKAPSGYKVTLFARVPGARVLSLGPDGALYVSQTSQGQVVRLVDTNGDGVADSQSVAVSNLGAPHGLAWRGSALYIATTGAVVRVNIANGRAAGSPQTLATYSSSGGHFTRSIVLAPDSAMYISIGSSCNLCVETSPDRAAVMRYDLEGRGGRVFSSGLRNAVGMAVNPVTRELWVSQNERDNLSPDHQDLPPEEINILRDGGDFGWPYCHSDRVPNPEYHDQARCDRTIAPALKMQAHAAPLGMTFLANATQFPADTRGDLLVAWHGSWNRDIPVAPRVVRVRIANNLPVSAEDFLSGFQRPDGSRWGRPTDVLVWKDGSVLVTEDLAGAIYRISR